MKTMFRGLVLASLALTMLPAAPAWASHDGYEDYETLNARDWFRRNSAIAASFTSRLDTAQYASAPLGPLPAEVHFEGEISRRGSRAVSAEGQFYSGIMTWPDGRRFEGAAYVRYRYDRTDPRMELIGEVEVIEGVVTWPDGRRFEGKGIIFFEETAEPTEGIGVMMWSDGRRYEGEVMRGQPFSWTGDGGPDVMTWPDGGRYEGTFGGAGRGFYTSPDGARYEAEWRSDLDMGQGVMTWRAGRRVTCFPCEDCERFGCDP